MKRFPNLDEIGQIMKKVEFGFDLEDWEIWFYKEFL